MLDLYNEDSGASCSASSRAGTLERMSMEKLDLLVIGGGITGCGIALDAALRGMRVGLVEMHDFASGTSSRSTKLIHGGLRYLKQGDVGLVREVGRERAILHRIAPHIIIPEPMLLPLYQGGTYGRFMTSFGLMLYDRLAGVRKHERRRMLSRAQTMRLEPLLKREGMKGGGLYVEYRTDDARLTIEVLKTAVSKGAMAINYVKADSFLYDDEGKISGVRAREQQSGRKTNIHAGVIVNAAGPWVDELRRIDGSLKGKRLHHTKGVHIVIDGSRFPLGQAVYFDVQDGRMIFAIPRDGKTYIGTTDTNYHGELEEPEAAPEDIRYLLDAVNRMFPTLELNETDITGQWCGLRPLIHEEGKSPSDLSRKDEIFVSQTGLITIAGGKLTGYRKMAERVVDLAGSRLEEAAGKQFSPCLTDRQPLSGGETDDAGLGSWELYLEEQIKAMRQNRRVAAADAVKLVRRYGTNLHRVLALLPDAERDASRFGIDALKLAELRYGIREEMVVTADDFLIRRTGDAYFEQAEAERLRPGVTLVIEAESSSGSR